MNGRHVFCVVAAMVALAASATLTVDKFEGTSLAPGWVEISCNAASTARGLWCAWGDKDYGTDFAAWPKNESLGAVAAGAVAWRGSLPQTARQAPYARLFFLSTDATGPLEYVRTTGEQYFDTEYYPDGGTSVSVTFEIDEFETNRNQVRPFGTRCSDPNLTNLTLDVYINGSDYWGGGKWAWGCRNGTGNWKDTGLLVDLHSVRYTLTLDNYQSEFRVQGPTNFIQDLSATVPYDSDGNGSRYRNLRAAWPLAICASRTSATAYGNPFYGTVYEAVIKNSNTVVRTFSPYLSGGSVGLRETLGGTFHGSKSATPAIGGGLTGVTALEGSAVLNLAELRSDDVFADADFWLRGMGVDANGNGVLDNNEIRDSLNRRTFASLAHGVEGHKIAFSNELVRLPGRGVARQMQTIVFRQDREWGDEAHTNANFYQNSVSLGSFPDYTNRYSMIIRFRPDYDTYPLSSSQWLVKFGHGTNRGLMYGVTGRTSKSRQLGIYAGGKNYLPSMTCVMPDNVTGKDVTTNYVFTVTNGWTDVGVSIDGQKLTMMVVRDGPEMGDKYCRLWVTTLSVESTRNLAPSGGFVLGTETTKDTVLKWATGASGNEYKCFSGSVQQLAMWKRPLSHAELLAAMGYPRPEVWKVGVEDDSTLEFGGEASADGVAVDGPWTVPQGISAGQSVTFKFPLTAKLDDQLSQFFRWKPTSDSGDGVLSAVLNGKPLGTKVVRAGKVAQWFVKSDLLQAGTNTLVVARTDAGTAPLKLDAATFGGGWQVGAADNSYTGDFAHENYGQIHYWVADGNGRDVKRVIFGTKYQSRTILMHSTMPKDLAGKYDWILRFKALGQIYGNSRLQLLVNGAERFNEVVKANQVYEIPLSADDLPAGENLFVWRNLDPTTQSPTKYFGFDCYQLEPVNAPSGTFLMVR